MADSGTRDRVARLAAIRAETAAKLGYSGSDAVSGADREKIELVAALTLQRELLIARMLSGHDIPPDALAKLSEQINAALPARSTPNFLSSIHRSERRAGRCWSSRRSGAIAR